MAMPQRDDRGDPAMGVRAAITAIYRRSSVRRKAGAEWRSCRIRNCENGVSDFAAVDRKADKFDLSLGALKNFFKGDDGDM